MVVGQGLELLLDGGVGLGAFGKVLDGGDWQVGDVPENHVLFITQWQFLFNFLFLLRRSAKL